MSIRAQPGVDYNNYTPNQLIIRFRLASKLSPPVCWSIRRR
jgi:hypothetical protein